MILSVVHDVRHNFFSWCEGVLCCAGFDSQQWYEQLFDYGMAASVGPGDADEELVPKLVRDLWHVSWQHTVFGFHYHARNPGCTLFKVQVYRCTCTLHSASLSCKEPRIALQ